MSRPTELRVFYRDWQLDPYPVYARLRDEFPVLRIDWPRRGKGIWAVSRHADIERVLAAPQFSVERHRSDLGPPEAGEISWEEARRREPLGESMVLVDAPRAVRLRNAANHAFTPRRIRELRRASDAEADELLATAASDSQLELISTLAAPLPSLAIARLLGVPREDLPQLRRQVATWIARGPNWGRGAVGPEVIAAVDGLRATLGEAIAKRRVVPQDDLISSMISGQDEVGGLTDAELMSTCLLLIGAGFDTTRGLIGNGTMALLSNPEAFAELASGDVSLPTAVDEFLRYDTPVQSVTRIALEDFALNDADGRETRIPRGAMTHLFLGAANRDSAQFEDPDRLDLARRPNRHLAFAHGLHFCLGSHLARQTAEAAFGALARRFEAIEVVPGGARLSPNLGLRSYSELWLRGMPRHLSAPS